MKRWGFIILPVYNNKYIRLQTFPPFWESRIFFFLVKKFFRFPVSWWLQNIPTRVHINLDTSSGRTKKTRTESLKESLILSFCAFLNIIYNAINYKWRWTCVLYGIYNIRSRRVYNNTNWIDFIWIKHELQSKVSLAVLMLFGWLLKIGVLLKITFITFMCWGM